MKSTDRRAESDKAHSEKLSRMLGSAEKYTDSKVAEHRKDAPHLKPKQVKKIADHEIEVKGGAKKKRLDRPGRKKGGRAKGDVNIIIAQKPDQPAMPAMGQGAPMPMPPRPPVQVPPPSAQMPPPGMPGAAPMPGGAAGMPPQMPRKKGGKAVKMEDGAGGGLGRLEKAAKYGARK